MSKGGRPKKIGEKEKNVLRQIVAEKPLASLDELTGAFRVPANSDGFVPLPRRLKVERTHRWNERARRLIMHHDRHSDVSEAWVWVTGAHARPPM